MNTDYSIIDLRKSKAHLQLLWIGIGSICMFFAGLTSIIFVDKMQFPELPGWFESSTFYIFCSSIFLITAKVKIKKNEGVSRDLMIVLACGLFFAYCQFRGWGDLVSNDIYFSGGMKESSLLYVLTGAHLAHLLFGLIALVITIINNQKNKYHANNYEGIKLASNYWHFLTILWAYLFLFLNYL